MHKINTFNIHMGNTQPSLQPLTKQQLDEIEYNKCISLTNYVEATINNKLLEKGYIGKKIGDTYKYNEAVLTDCACFKTFVDKFNNTNNEMKIKVIPNRYNNTINYVNKGINPYNNKLEYTLCWYDGYGTANKNVIPCEF